MTVEAGKERRNSHATDALREYFVTHTETDLSVIDLALQFGVSVQHIRLWAGGFLACEVTKKRIDRKPYYTIRVQKGARIEDFMKINRPKEPDSGRGIGTKSTGTHARFARRH